MLRIHSFLQSIYRYLQSISKKMYRTCAIIATGTLVVSIIALNSNGFNGSGKNRVMAYKDQESESNQEEDEEVEADTKAKVQTESLQSDIEAQSIIADVPEAARLGIDNVYEQMYRWKEREEKELEVRIQNTAKEGLSLIQQTIQESTEQKEEQETIPEEMKEETELSSVSKPTRTVSDYEYDILIHIVAAEAGGCDITGQILVANVILNRVENSKFPDTIEGVVFQKNQFSPVVYGTLWKTKVPDTTREAVNRALSGEDYSQGALFFSARARLGDASMSWFDNNLHWLFEHDGHEFYKFKE